MKKIGLLSIVLALIVMTYSNASACGCLRLAKIAKELQNLEVEEGNAQEIPKLSDEDKSFIIKSILEQDFEIKRQISQESTEEKLFIKLSGENINAKLLPKFPHVEFVLLNADDIKNYKGKSHIYREFGKFEVNAFGRVTVVFSKTNLHKGFFPTESETTYEYQKVSGKWVGKVVGYTDIN